MANEHRPAPSGYPIKLVRDATPAIINASGEPGELFYSSIPQHERPKWLRRKLAEEVCEYLEDRDLSELAQALLVVEALALSVHGMTLSQLHDHGLSNPAGGFLDGMMMYGLHREYDR